jgi:hypothetical protein
MKFINVAIFCVTPFFVGMLGTQPAAAGPYTDDLARCLVKSTTDGDKNSLVKWMFAMAALHPAVESIATVSAVERKELTKYTAVTFEKLLTKSCRSEVQQAVKYEGPSTIGSSFQILGQVATRELFSHPNVVKSMGEFANYMDNNKLQEVLAPNK